MGGASFCPGSALIHPHPGDRGLATAPTGEGAGVTSLAVWNPVSEVGCSGGQASWLLVPSSPAPEEARWNLEAVTQPQPQEDHGRLAATSRPPSTAYGWT